MINDVDVGVHGVKHTHVRFYQFGGFALSLAGRKTFETFKVDRSNGYSMEPQEWPELNEFVGKVQRVMRYGYGYVKCSNGDCHFCLYPY